MSRRQAPKGLKVKEIYVGCIDFSDGLTLAEIATWFESIDTQDLIDPKFYCDYYDCNDLYVVGFIPKSELELRKEREQAEKRKVAAEKRQIAIANKEKAQLKKLAEKYPEVIRSDSYIV